MKAQFKHLTTAGIMALLAMRAQAIEAPADDSLPPQVAGKLQSSQPTQPIQSQSAFIGIVAEDIPEMLADHIGINPGDGIFVKSVMPDGPAAKAGIRNNDVITQVGDKTMRSAEDLTRAVSAKKPGEFLHLKLIQHGKASELDVQLGNRSEAMAFQQPQRNSKPLDQLKLDDVPSDITDRMRGMIEENLKNFDNPLKGMRHFGMGMDQDMEQAILEMRKRMQMPMDDADAADAADGGGIHFQQNATIKMLDQDGSVEMQSKNDSHEVTVRDKDHKVLWSGPWNNDQDKAAAPEAIRNRVDRLNFDTTFSGNGFRMRINPKSTIDN